MITAQTTGMKTAPQNQPRTRVYRVYSGSLYIGDVIADSEEEANAKANAGAFWMRTKHDKLENINVVQ